MNLLGIDVVNTTFGDVEGGFVINPDMTLREHFMSLGIIAGGVGINVRIAEMDRDVAVCDGNAVFISRLATGSDFDWLIFRGFEINRACACDSKDEKRKDRCPRSHGAPQGTARPSGCKGKRDNHESADRYFSPSQHNASPPIC